MDLQTIQFDTLDADTVDHLALCENNLRFDGDRNPLQGVRSIIAALNKADAWPGRDVLATPENGLVNEGIDLKVSVPGGAYVSCFIDSIDELMGEDDWSWRNVARTVTDRLNTELQSAREGLLAPALP